MKFVDPRTVEGFKLLRVEKRVLMLLGAILDQQIMASGKTEPEKAPDPKKPEEPAKKTLGMSGRESNARR